MIVVLACCGVGGGGRGRGRAGGKWSWNRYGPIAICPAVAGLRGIRDVNAARASQCRGIGETLIRLDGTYIGRGAWAHGHSTESRRENGRTFTVGTHATRGEH